MKEAEAAAHSLMAQDLATLERNGIQAFVAAGNHDTNNPDALDFDGDNTRPLLKSNPLLFRAIHECFGYCQENEGSTCLQSQKEEIQALVDRASSIDA